jgi:signal transduction histidine kinase
VENALRHTPRGSHIQVRAAAAAQTVELAVVDDGPGVPAAERERLFDRFYRLERSRSTPGSGLGLSLVAAVARLHRADVSLGDGRPGLVVRIAFPAA